MQELVCLLFLILMPFEAFSWAFSSGTIYMPSSYNMCHGYGERSISTVVTFPTPFEKVPTVLISTKSFDLGAQAAIMVTYVQSVTTTNFVLKWRTWYKWSICFSDMTWFAYSDEQPRTNSNQTANNSTTTNLTATNTTTPVQIVPVTTSERLYTFANLSIDKIIIICLVSSVASLILSLALCLVFIKGRQDSQSSSDGMSSHMSGLKNGDKNNQQSMSKGESHYEISSN